jgi:Flp pilus assembly protein TadG
MGDHNGKMKRRTQAGQTIVFLTFGLTAIIAAAGLAIDMGYLRYEKRLMQSAADSAALAAATDENLGDAAMAGTDALAVASANGFINGTNNTTVTTSFPGVTPGTAVQVQVQQVLPSFFMQIAGVPTSTISATAVATVAASNGCIYALRAGGLTLNAGVNAPNCGIVDNGPLTGGGDTIAASVGVYGSSAGYGGTPAPETIAQPAADPLAYLKPPTPSACATPLTITTTVTVTEGTYCGIIINSGGNVTFSAGLYMLTGGTGLQISGTGIANGTAGVTFYNTGTGAVTFSGTGNVSLSAPDEAEVSGDPSFGNLPPGILFYQDPVDTSASDVSEGASGNVTLNGALYFPSAQLTIAGAVTGTNALVVAGSVTVSGSTILDSDSTSVPGGSPLRTVTLVE